MKKPALLGLALAAAFTASSVSGATFLSANLTRGQEVSGGSTPTTTSTGDPRPTSFGAATFTLNDAQTQLSMVAVVYDIDVTGSQTPDANDNLSAAHIHVGAGMGTNASVRWGFFGSPDNDNNPDNLIVTPFATGVGGTFTSIWDAPEGNSGTTLASNLPDILNGLSYLNFHTVQFPGGEIRGQIQVVPEPSTFALLGGGAAALAFGVFRRKRK